MKTSQKISQVMMHEIIVASPEYTLEQAAQIIRENDLDVLPICENDKLIGMISNIDIDILMAAQDASLKQTKLRYLMTSEARYVFDDQSTGYAAKYMAEYQLQRLLVLNRDNRLVGVLSSANLLLIEENAALVA